MEINGISTEFFKLKFSMKTTNQNQIICLQVGAKIKLSRALQEYNQVNKKKQMSE